MWHDFASGPQQVSAPPGRSACPRPGGELVVLVRRFRCRALHCPAGIFAERFLPAVARPHARRTSRLQGLVRHLGLALGGRPAQALAGRLLLPVGKAIGAKTLDPMLLTAAERLQYEGFQRRQLTNRMVRQVANDGVAIPEIVRLSGLSRDVVRQIIRGEREDVFRVRASSLTPWLPQLEREWASGRRNGAELWRWLRAGGFQGRLRVVGECATRQRRAEQAVSSGTAKSTPARRIARLLTMGRGHLCRSDAIQVARIEAALPALATARRLTERFTDMVRNAREDALEIWLDEAKESLLGAFARGLRRDQAAVAAALRLPWPNGQTEGQINRLKTLKRQIHGRANIDLLRARLVEASYQKGAPSLHQN